ncbi:uncharacterized protein LOC122253145 isoform X3 [Penaeus japonicus]|uniref:uncharacterized protein LOC122253145 isoform X3 n=1 Tax=Penaeus japonicus TaxID=27405 RepID=UPI001C7107C7|nr:uncharacterized protein LOC122253145 isoform X3 [Penaeus japonicus]
MLQVPVSSAVSLMETNLTRALSRPCVSKTMPRQHSTSMTQLTRCTINGFRYHVAVGTIGHAVFAQVVEWLYQGGPCVRTYFLSLGHLDADYERTFNIEQRQMLENGALFKEYDISLLYLILQTMCGLAGPGDPSCASSSTGQPLGHLLHKLYQKRSHLALSDDVQQMSEQKLKKELAKLKRLFSRILRLAGNRCGMRPHVFRDEVWEVKQDLQDLMEKVREPLQSSELSNLPQLQQEIQVFKKTLSQKVEEQSQQELRGFYPQLWDVALVQWLYPELTVQPSLNFTNLVIMENMESLPPLQEQNLHGLSHKDLLQVTHQNGSLPEVIIISGEGGIGKTTLLKYMLEMWVRDPSQIKGLRTVSPLMYLQLRGSSISSWKDMLQNVLYNTFQESGLTIDFFVDLFQAMHVVVLLDGYDEVSPEAKKLITDLAKYQGNMRVVITTRPSSLKELKQMVSKKQVMNIEIKGIRREDWSLFIENTLVALVQEPVCRSGVKERVIAHLDHLDLRKREVAVPLTLVLLIVREVEAPGQRLQDIYEDLTNLMVGKIEERLVIKGIDDAEDKVIEYNEFQKSVALRCLKKREHDLSSETVEDLKAKCDSLNLPYIEVLSGFLISKKCRQGLHIIHVWSFPHNRFQEHWASSYIAKRLLNMSHSMPDLTGLLDFPFLTDVDQKKKLGEPGLPTEEEVVAFMFNKNPVLQIYADGIDEARELIWQNIEGDISVLVMEILFNIARILSLSHKSLLDEVAPAIISLILYSDHSHLIQKDSCHRICETVMASGQHAGILEAAAKVVRNGEKWMTRGEYLPGFMALFDYVKPCCVEVIISKDTEEFPPSWQLSCLEALSKQEIELILIIYDIKNSIQFCETCLKAVTGPGSLSRLTKFEGDLTAAGMQVLPESLKELIARTDKEGVQALVKRLPQLQSLLNLDLKSELTEAEMRLLPSSLRKLDVKADSAGLRALAARLPHLGNLQHLGFEGQLAEAEMPLLPAVLFLLRVETDGAGLRALASRLPQLRKLFSLNIKLLDCPPAESLSAIPFEGLLLTLDLDHATPPSLDWVSEAVYVLCSGRKKDFQVVTPSSCDTRQVQSIAQELRDRGAEVADARSNRLEILSWTL